MNSTDTCPQCGSMNYKRNGRIHTGKQNHRCKDGGRQFVLSAENRRISDAERALIKRLLNERVSLRGICRAVQVSLRWLVDFVVSCYAAAPDDLNVRLPEQPDEVIVQRLVVECGRSLELRRQESQPTVVMARVRGAEPPSHC